jgi:two-component system, cell cycle response regulator
MSTTASKVSASTPAANTSGTRPCVLVADDSRVIRSAIKKILDGEFEVVLVESGDAAWDLLSRENNVQMLVTDIEMPGIDGYELICRVRGSDQSKLKEMPILTITGADDEQTKERAFACGATDFITKPIDGIQLKARVQSYARLDKSVRDITEKATQLEEQAINDPVTSLRSRRYFLQRGEQDIAFCVRNQQDTTIIRFDIDRHKEIYRKYGDDVNDRIFAWLAGVVSADARTEDTVARVGGAKFAVLATNTDMRNAKRLCQRIREAIHAKPFLHDGKIVELTLSFGLSSLAQDKVQQVEALLELAEQRVIRAAADGGDRVCISVLGEIAPNIEEVVIDMPPPAADTSPRAPVPEAVVELPTLSGLDDLEIPGADVAVEAPDLGISEIAEADPHVAHLISVDKVLQLIANGQEKLVEPYLKTVLQQLRPLLDLATRKR